MSWATRRRFFIVLLLLIVAGGLLYWHYVPVIYKAPTCTDGIQDGDEAGVDCGGTMCTNLCQSQVVPPTIIWSRAFPVTDTVYNAAAYIENANNAAVQSMPYEFRLYDQNDILAARVDGVAIIPPLGRYVIVETGINVGTATIKSTDFAFSSSPALWQRVTPAQAKYQLATSATALDVSKPIPKLSTTLTNPFPNVTFSNTTVAAVLYDANDNAVAVSRTVVPMLNPGESTQLYFTWPRPLSAPVVRYDIIPIIDIFNAK